MSPLRNTSDQLAIHARTPALVVSDPRGLAVRAIGYYRREPGVSAQPRVNAQWYDEAGRAVAQWDPRQFAHFEAGLSETPNQRTVFSLSNQALAQRSTDSGWKVTLTDVLGLPRVGWDSRGACTMPEYDTLMRLVAVTIRDSLGYSRTTQRLHYCPVDATQAALNRCGALCRHDDEAGSLYIHNYALLGDVGQTTRRYFAQDRLPDWPREVSARDLLLEPGPGYTSQSLQDATSAEVRTIDALGNIQTSSFGMSGAVCSSLLITAAGTEYPLLTSVTFDAAGNTLTQTTGNGLVSHAEHDPISDRLLRLYTARGDGGMVQDLHYQHDPMGNILSITDATQSVRYFANQQTTPVNRYSYDSFYQLIAASGREAANNGNGPALPGLHPLPNDPTLLLNYTQDYRYDEGGNLVELRHVNGQRNHTQRMATARFSNRSLPETNGQLPDENELAASFDASGNLQRLQPGQVLTWDCRDQLQQVTPVVRNAAEDDYERYAYDVQGVRVRKTTSTQVRSGTCVSDVRYLPGLEIRTNTRTGEELHVIAAYAGSCAVRLLHWQAGKPQQLVNDQLRYALDNHVGSCTLELDGQGHLLSREEYYPFGGTACVAGRSAVEAKYKVIRYSGKERDASGLYYYGLRYYAPWLQRWLNPDPKGDVDGLNRYRMVSNNPINKVDPDGGEEADAKTRRAKKSLGDTFRFWMMDMVNVLNEASHPPGPKRLEAKKRSARDQARVQAQSEMERKLSLLHSMFELTKQATHTADMAIASMESNRAFAKSAAMRGAAIVASNGASLGAGIGLAVGLAPLVSPAISIPVGIAVTKVVSVAVDKAGEAAGVPTTLHLQSGSLNPHSIKHSALFKKHAVPGKTLAKLMGMIPSDQKGATNLGVELFKSGGGAAVKTALHSSGAGLAWKIAVDGVKAMVEASSVVHGKLEQKMLKVEDNGASLIRELTQRSQEVIIGMAPNGFDPDGVLGHSVFKKVTVGSIANQLGDAITRIENTRSNARAYRTANPNSQFYA